MRSSENDNVKRCTKCILPLDYPGIGFNETGVCSFCEQYDHYEPITYLGRERLERDIKTMLERHPTRKYDCVIGCSGGRDSTYLLHILKKELGLNVLVFFIDHGYIPEHTKDNIGRLTKQLGVDLVVHKHRNLQNCFPYQFKAWLKNPRPQTISTFCMGCKYTITDTFYHLARKHQAPLMVQGWTPFEYASYKMDLMKSDPSSESTLSYIRGYLKEVALNPHLIMNPGCAMMQVKEFMMYDGPMKRINDRLFKKTEVKPFERHIHWLEKEVVDLIVNEYGWKNFNDMKSTWRGDCYLGPIRQFLYKSLLGYNDHTPHLSDLIRDGQITRDEALARVAEDETISQSVLQECCNKADIDFDELMKAAGK